MRTTPAISTSCASSPGPTTSCTATPSPSAGSSWRGSVPTPPSPPMPRRAIAACAAPRSASAPRAWLFPLFSSRWHDLFAYGQIKTAVNLGLPVHPYVSLRFVGDTRRTVGSANPELLSESSFIVAVGASTRAWHGLTAWGEAGTSISYLRGHMLPDYRGRRLGGAHPPPRGQRLAGRHLARRPLHQPLRQRFSGLFPDPRRLRFRARATPLERQPHGGCAPPGLGQFRRNRSRTCASRCRSPCI